MNMTDSAVSAARLRRGHEAVEAAEAKWHRLADDVDALRAAILRADIAHAIKALDEESS